MKTKERVCWVVWGLVLSLFGIYFFSVSAGRTEEIIIKGMNPVWHLGVLPVWVFSIIAILMGLKTATNAIEGCRPWETESVT